MDVQPELVALADQPLPLQQEQSDQSTAVPPTNRPLSLGLSKLSLLLDSTSPLEELRWVGSEFVYFVDIPWPPRSLDSTSPFHLPDDSGSLSDRNGPVSLWTTTLGILEVFLGLAVPEDCLSSRDPSGNVVLSGEKLSRLVVPRARRLCNSDSSVTRPIAEAFNPLIVRVASAIDQALLSKTSETIDINIFVAVSTMLLALARCARAALKDPSAVQVLDGTIMLQEIITCYRERLHNSWSADTGFEIERLLGAGIPFVAYAIASKPTINRSKVIDPANYAPLHVDPTCTCRFTGPPVSDVVALLAQHRIPVIVLEGERVSVRDAADGPYLSVSHVWADGLGSTTEEGLPTCQIARLSRLAHQLIPDGAFWLDALCVPRDKESRRRAIGLMAGTYERANKTLVIDGGVLTQCSLSSPKEELLLRIATSGWMQRIWTLQEGMLSRELFFEVSDGIIDCTYFNGAPYTIAQEVIPLFLHRPRDDSQLEYRPILPIPPRCTFNEIIPLLRHRETSKPEDETIAISGLLGIDAGELAALPSGKSRMRMLLLRCVTLPRCIAVYGWHSRKLDLPGFTWAPMSISEVFWWGDPLDPLWATCTEQGLRGLYTVIRFPPVDLGDLSGGLVATVTSNEDVSPGVDLEQLKSISSLSSRMERVTTGVRIAISELFRDVRRKNTCSLVVNAVLITRSGLPQTEREEPLAAVHISPLDRSDGRDTGIRLSEDESLRCEFIAPGKLQVDPPNVRATLRAQDWMSVEATMERLVPILLT